ncbi:MAG TPA: threonine synthase [Actinobacteria bacterium]|nr:threonine synthase [Actinomycetota bacterium]
MLSGWRIPVTKWRGIIEEYRDFLPVSDKTPVVTLLEGGTPLIHARRLSEELGLEIFLKYEGLNPTGSFKDRGMTMAISKALEEGAVAVMCASTGNTSASAAAYAARSGLKCLVVIPCGKIALGKLAQALMHGAKVIAIKGNFDAALKIVRELTDKHPIALVNSLNPYRLEGQKTGAFEVCDVLGDAPDYLAIPVGNAGNITAYWMGFRQYYEAKISKRLPRMIGFQAEGAAPIVRGYLIEKPETIATAIRIGNPARWKEAVEAASSSGGWIDMVSDDEILSAYGLLASTEGIFAEPASAASIAGVKKFVTTGRIEKGARVVCVLTGHGLKDPDIAIKAGGKIIEVQATTEAVESIVL